MSGNLDGAVGFHVNADFPRLCRISSGEISTGRENSTRKIVFAIDSRYVVVTHLFFERSMDL